MIERHLSRFINYVTSADLDDSLIGWIFRFAIPFLLGAILSTLLSNIEPAIQLMDGTSPLGNKVAFFIILGLLAFSLVGLGIGYVVMQLVRTTNNRNRFTLFVDRDFHREGKTHHRAFNRCLSEALRAKSSIHVLSPHFPDTSMHMNEEENLNSSDQAHGNYLEGGMEEVIERHVKDVQSDFTYKRVVQLDSGIIESMREDGVVDKSLFGNDAMAIHVEKMIQENEMSHSVDLRVHARTFVPSFPSTLVIDDKYVFFSLPTYTSSENKTDARTLEYDFVLGIQDNTGELPKIFRQIITQFEIAGREIKAVTTEQK